MNRHYLFSLDIATIVTRPGMDEDTSAVSIPIYAIILLVILPLVFMLVLVLVAAFAIGDAIHTDTKIS